MVYPESAGTWPRDGGLPNAAKHALPSVSRVSSGGETAAFAHILVVPPRHRPESQTQTGRRRSRRYHSFPQVVCHGWCHSGRSDVRNDGHPTAAMIARYHSRYLAYNGSLW